MDDLVGLAEAVMDDEVLEDRLDGACEQEAAAYAAYELILDAPDRPAYIAGDFYIDAARLRVSLVKCLRGKWEMSPSEAIDTLMDDIDHYPQKQVLVTTFASPIDEFFEDQVKEAHELGVLVDRAAELVSALGEYLPSIEDDYDGLIMDKLYSELCGTFNPDFKTAGVAKTKRAIICPSTLAKANLSKFTKFARSPDEAWFTLEYRGRSYVGKATYTCQAYNTATMDSFKYTKEGQFQEVFVLIDTRTGKVSATKSFKSTTPKCCTSGTYSGGTVYTCIGGRDPSSTYSNSALISWLNARTN